MVTVKLKRGNEVLLKNNLVLSGVLLSQAHAFLVEVAGLVAPAGSGGASGRDGCDPREPSRQ